MITISTAIEIDGEMAMESEKKCTGNMETATFKLEGMGCACEAKIIEKRIKSLKGVITYDINPISNWIKISFEPSLVSTEDIKKAISKSGITASLMKRK